VEYFCPFIYLFKILSSCGFQHSINLYQNDISETCSCTPRSCHRKLIVTLFRVPLFPIFTSFIYLWVPLHYAAATPAKNCITGEAEYSCGFLAPETHFSLCSSRAIWLQQHSALQNAFSPLQ
jgi:hypothetical protein